MHDEQRARLVRCERHGLAYDAEKATGCALCKSESRRPSGFPPLDRVMMGLLAGIIVMLAGGVLVHLGTPALERWLDAKAPAASSASAPVPSPVAAGALQSGTFALRARNAIGRGGMLFIPPEAKQGPRPLLILFHGTGGSGAQILATFAPVARQRGLVVLAPDSARSPDGSYAWQVPDRPGALSIDLPHVRACLDEVYATPHLALDPLRVLAAGHSAGGSTAAYLGTTDRRVRAFAVLHGGVFVGGLGSSDARAWFSTGTDDPFRAPDVVERAAAATRAHASDVKVSLYPGGHGLSVPEIEDVIAWWLDAPGDAQSGARSRARR